MFQWDVTPEQAFGELIREYTQTSLDTIFGIAIKHAALMQTYIRANATWEDDCMPGREYLIVEAYIDDTNEVGIRAYYDLALYRENCGEKTKYPWEFQHEFKTFKDKGVIAVINRRGEMEGGIAKTVLGSLADDFWDEIRALYSSSGAGTP